MSILRQRVNLLGLAGILFASLVAAQEPSPIRGGSAQRLQTPSSAQNLQPAQAFERIGKQLYPQQPTGRTTLQRSQTSPWIERFLRLRRNKSQVQVDEQPRAQAGMQTRQTAPRTQPSARQPVPQPVQPRATAGNQSNRNVRREYSYGQPLRGPDSVASQQPQAPSGQYRIRTGTDSSRNAQTAPPQPTQRTASLPPRTPSSYTAEPESKPEPNTPPQVSRVPLPDASLQFQQHAAEVRMPSDRKSSRSPRRTPEVVQTQPTAPSNTTSSREPASREEKNLNRPKAIEEPVAPPASQPRTASRKPNPTATLAVQQSQPESPSTVSVPTQLTAAPMAERAAEKEAKTRPQTQAPATQLYGLASPQLAAPPVVQTTPTENAAPNTAAQTTTPAPAASPSLTLDSAAAPQTLLPELPQSVAAPSPAQSAQADSPATAAPTVAAPTVSQTTNQLPALPALPAMPAPSAPSTLAVPSQAAVSGAQTTPAPQAVANSPATTAAPPAVSGQSIPTQPAPSATLPSVAASPATPSGKTNLVPGNSQITQSTALRPRVARTPNERFRMQNPSIHVLLDGPRNMPIGTTAQYAVRVVNTDELDLKGLLLRLEVPGGVTVSPKQPTHGEMDLERAPDGSVMLTWGIEELIAGETARAPLNILAQSPQDFTVGLEWTLVPLSKSATVHVMSPQLRIEMAGPSDVISGEKNTYRLVVSNDGESTANNVVVSLGAEEFGSTSSKLGNIPAGSERDVEIEMQFKERGMLDVMAVAAAQGKLTSETKMNIRVRQPSLIAEITAPKMVYHGSATTYTVRIRNEGDAPAKGLTGRLMLPSGARPNALPYAASYSDGQLSWPIEGLAAGASAEFKFQINLAHEGENSLDLAFGDRLGNAAQAQVITLVRSIADLKLVVSDPVAPAPVGNEVVYELKLTNRGSKAARDVKVIAQFSEGIEPTRGSGHGFRVVPGQLYFEPIDTISAGETVVLRVFAQAEGQGMHRFRTEVRADAGIRLTQEESTEYLADQAQIATQQSTLNLGPSLR